MPRADIYRLPHSADGGVQFACRLTQKAFQQGYAVRLQIADRQRAAALDKSLWDFRPDSFVPHTLSDAGAEDRPAQIVVPAPVSPDSAPSSPGSVSRDAAASSSTPSDAASPESVSRDDAASPGSASRDTAAPPDTASPGPSSRDASSPDAAPSDAAPSDGSASRDVPSPDAASHNSASRDTAAPSDAASPNSTSSDTVSSGSVSRDVPSPDSVSRDGDSPDSTPSDTVSPGPKAGENARAPQLLAFLGGPPETAPDCERVAEILITEDEARAAERLEFYRTQGYEVYAHSIPAS